jgi:uncharacterized protein
VASAPEAALPPPPSDTPATADGGFPRWPLWAPFLAVLIGATASIVIVGMLAALLQAADSSIDKDSPWLTVLSTVGLDLCVIGAIVGVAHITTKPRPWQFGLRPAPLGHAIAMAFIAVITFLAFELTYKELFNPKNPQKIVEDLGADQSTVLLVSGAIAVIVVAPVAEELLFRGFLFRVLRLRMGFWAAAVIDGALFGLVHGSLVILPILAVLGVALCWVYERTGSLFPCIAIHALNNTIAYGGTTNHGWAAAGVAGGVMLAACVTVPGMLRRRAPSPV